MIIGTEIRVGGEVMLLTAERKFVAWATVEGIHGDVFMFRDPFPESIDKDYLVVGVERNA